MKTLDENTGPNRPLTAGNYMLGRERSGVSKGVWL